MKTPLPEPVAWKHRSNSDHFIERNPGGEVGFLFVPLFTEAQLRAAMVAAYNEAIDEAIDCVAFNGGSVQLEAHIRQLKETP